MGNSLSIPLEIHRGNSTGIFFKIFKIKKKTEILLRYFCRDTSEKFSGDSTRSLLLPGILSELQEILEKLLAELLERLLEESMEELLEEFLEEYLEDESKKGISH